MAMVAWRTLRNGSGWQRLLLKKRQEGPKAGNAQEAKRTPNAKKPSLQNARVQRNGDLNKNRGLFTFCKRPWLLQNV